MSNKKQTKKERDKRVKSAVKAAKKNKTLVAVLLTLLIIVLIAAIVLYAVKPPFIQPFLIKIGLMDDPSADNGDDNNDGGNNGSDGEDSDLPSIGDAGEISSAGLSVHFLELGNKYTGDCTLIKCGNTEVLIDAGSKRNSAPHISKYIAQYCTDNVLEYVIATHAHEDHIAGFAGSATAKDGIIYEYSQNGKSIGTIIEFSKHNTASKIYSDYCDAVETARQNGTKVFTAEQCYNLTDGAERSYFLDENKKISLNILYNYYYFNKSSDENNYSVVTLLTEEIENGKRNYLFTGDLEEDGEKKMVDYYTGDMPLECVTEYNVLPEVDVYKAGHHGSKTSSSEKLLNVIKPKNVAVCCCAGSPEYTTNSDNTFPTQQAISNISKYTQNVYVTSVAVNVPEAVDGVIPEKTWDYASMNGNIVFYVSGNALKLWCSNNTTVLKETEWFIKNRVWE